ncbi:hypothetical protein [Oceanicola sp. 22II-s10i]|uniref:hypothetical protein n=1 Tax=Oceanicola sp. 22II-s10i TaxID=1317116 RepID=UPI0015959935|nr:hypothetical protein [Oceanicola sp. 22II-s10i]
MTDLSKTAFDRAVAVAQTDWLPPEAPLAMPRQVLERPEHGTLMSLLARLLMPVKRV